MPQAQNWNKSQSLQSTLFFPPLLLPLCMPFFVLLSLTLSCLPPPYSTTAIFLFASPLYLMPICTRLPFFFFSLSPHFGLLLFLVSCCFSLKCFAAEMRLLAIFTKKQSNLMPLEAIKEKTSLVPVIENSITVSHSAFQ